MKKVTILLFALFLWMGTASATTLTTTSLTSKGALPSGITEIGGIVLDLVGSNGVRITSQLSASDLYQGFFSVNPGIIGTQTGFDAATVNALGGGISEAAVRISLYDGDTASGNFDFDQNDLLLNNINFGNFSDVFTDRTDSTGVISDTTEYGFQNNKLNTGFFYSNDATTLAAFYASLTTETVVYALTDIDPTDNFFDFTQGIDGSLIDIGTGPTINNPNPTPEPATMVLFGIGLLGAAGISRRKRT